MAYDIAALDSKKQDPADWTHPIDLIEPEEDRDDFIDVEGLDPIPVDAVRILLGTIVTKTPMGARDWKTATARLAVLCQALDVADLGKASLTSIAEQIGVSRALLSHRSVALRDYTGMRKQVSDTARQTYAKRCSDVWEKKKFSTDDPTEQISIWNK